MEITRLRLQNFRRHRELDIDLAPGLNVIRGANESGKSTIQKALEMGLFRRPTSSSQDLDDSRPWTDTQADPVVEIDFKDDELSGSLRKAFAGQRGTVELRLGDETTIDPAAAEARVAQLTGLPSEKFFRATASIHHQELGGLTQDEGTLRDRLQRSMSGADRGTYHARRKLEEASRRYKTEGPKNPGYLKVMRTDVERLRSQVLTGEAALAELERDRRALAETRATRATLENELSEQRDGLARAERAASLKARLSEAQRRYAIYRRAAEIRAEVAELEASHPSAIPLSELRSTVDKLRNLEFDISEMRAELAAEPDLAGYDVALAIPRWRPWAVAGAALLIGALVVAIGGLVLQSTVVGLVVAVLLAAIGAFALWRSFGMRQRVGDIRLQNELRETEIARRLAGRAEIGERARQAEQNRTQLLASLGMPDLARADATLAAEAEHSAKIDTLRAEYRGMLGEGIDDQVHDAEVAATRDQAAAEADECRHALDGMDEIGRDPDRHLTLYRQGVQRLTPRREAALQAQAQAEARVSANEIDAEKVAADAEALEDAHEALAAAERRVRIYENVLATLNSAERATMKKAARFLEQQMARDIDRVTGGRYRRLKVDEATLTFSVYSPETNDWLDVRRLSQGTLDQLYLCARMGIVRQVAQPATPPLVLDDPFITFDDERAQRAFSLLKDIAREHQVIYLTTSARYDRLADKVIELPAPAERDEPETLAAAAGPAETLSVWPGAALPEPVAQGGRQAAGGDRGAETARTARPPAPLPRASRPAASPQASPGSDSTATPLWPAEER